MQIKTITKVITKKLEDWLSSISDEKLREQVKKNILLSGGSITSLLQQQDVNDYDIYLKDPNVLLKLVEYYTQGMKYVEIWDGRDKSNNDAYLNSRHFTTSDDGYESDLAKRSVALRTLRQDQIKLYLPTGGLKVDHDEATPYQVEFLSPNAISLSDNISIEMVCSLL